MYVHLVSFEQVSTDTEVDVAGAEEGPPFSWSPSKSEGDVGLILTCPIPKLDALLCLANAKFALGSSLIFLVLTSNFDMIACSASWIASVFT